MKIADISIDERLPPLLRSNTVNGIMFPNLLENSYHNHALLALRELRLPSPSLPDILY